MANGLEEEEEDVVEDEEDDDGDTLYITRTCKV